MKVIITNWINVLGVFITVLLYAIILNFTDVQATRTLFQSILAALVLILGYGMMFWIAFVISLIILDLVLINKNRSNLRIMLLVEWTIISSPFIYWAIKYNEWIFVAAIIAFIVTQLLRVRRIAKI